MVESGQCLLDIPLDELGHRESIRCNIYQARTISKEESQGEKTLLHDLSRFLIL